MVELITSVLFLLAFAVGFTAKFSGKVFRMTKEREMIQDLGDGAWTLSIFNDYIWISRFSSDWRAKHTSTWMFGIARERWFYIPEMHT